MNEQLAFFIIKCDDPLKLFDCRYCHKTHIEGPFRTRNHRLAVLCANILVSNPNQSWKQITPLEVLDLDLPDGVWVECVHDLDLNCPANLLVNQLANARIPLAWS